MNKQPFFIISKDTGNFYRGIEPLTRKTMWGSLKEATPYDNENDADLMAMILRHKYEKRVSVYQHKTTLQQLNTPLRWNMFTIR